MANSVDPDTLKMLIDGQRTSHGYINLTCYSQSGKNKSRFRTVECKSIFFKMDHFPLTHQCLVYLLLYYIRQIHFQSNVYQASFSSSLPCPYPHKVPLSNANTVGPDPMPNSISMSSGLSCLTICL